jgi:hypothetical protein
VIRLGAHLEVEMAYVPHALSTLLVFSGGFSFGLLGVE